MASAGTIEVFLTANTAGMEAGLRRAETRLGKAERRFRSFGSAMTTGLTVPIVGVGAAAGAAAVSVENAMTEVAKTTDAPQARIAELREEFEKLNDRIPLTTQELANIAATAGQLGVPIDQIRDFTETVAALQVSTDLGGDEAAKQLARLMNVMGNSEDQIDRVGSSLVALGNNLEATESEILQVTGFFSGTANAVGATTAEVLALSGALRAVGARPRAGAVGVRDTFKSMQGAVEGVNDNLQTFATLTGRSSAEFRKLFTQDPTEAFLQFLEGLRQVDEQGGSVLQTFEALDLTNTRVQRSLQKLVSAEGGARRAVELANQEFENNVALTEEAQKFYDRLGADFKTFASEAIDTAASLGRELAPSFRTILDAGRSALNVIGELIKMFADLPQPVQATAIGLTGIFAALGPVAFGISQVLGVGNALIGVAANLAGTIAGGAGLTASLGTLGTMLAGGGLVIGGLLGLSAVFQEITDNVEEAKRAADNFIDSTEGMSGAALKRNREVLRERQQNLLDARDRLQNTIGELEDQGAADRIIAGKRNALEKTKRDLRLVNDQLRAVNSQIEKRQTLPPLSVTVSGGEEGGVGVAGEAGKRQKALRQLRQQVQTARQQERLLGDRFDLNSELARVYRQNIQSLLDAGFKPQSEEVQRAVREYLQYQRAVELTNHAQEQQQKAQRKVNRAMSTFNSLIRSSRTPMQRHNRRMQQLQTLLERGEINQQEFNRAQRQSLEQAQEQARDAAKQTGRALEDEMRQAGRSAIQGLISGFIRGGQDLGDRLENAALSIVETFLTNKIMGALGIASPSTVAMGWGESLVEGFAVGMEQHGRRLEQAAGRVFRIGPPDMAFSGAPQLTGARSAVQGAARIDLSQVDPPKAVTPREQALNDYWQRLHRETARVAEGQGFRTGS